MKNKELKQLDEICNKVVQAYGTLYTNGIALDYHIERQIERCNDVGIRREEIKQILLKYQN